MARGPQLNVTLDRLAYGGVTLFAGFRLTVAAGETVAVMGRSGVGKTTLLRLLAGVETGFVGQVTVEGIAADLAPAAGMVFQDARLLPWLTCAQNLRAVCPDVDVARALAAVGLAEVGLAEVGLAGLGDMWPRQLSGGMQRRLGLARALVASPGLLLLDEPFASLDLGVVRDLQALVAGVIAARAATAVIVSHDPGDAARLAQRVVVIAGRPVQIVADIALDRDPAQRTPAQIAEVARQIAAALAQTA